MTYFKAFTFDGYRSANKAVSKMEDADFSYIWMEEGDYASVSRNKKGHFRVHSKWAQDSSLGSYEFSLGALLGGMIGLFFGPGGALAGAAIGGGTGSLIGKSINVKVDNPVLDKFAQSLVPDSSALIILGPKKAIDEFTSELADYEVKIFETELDEAILDALKKAMKK